MGRSIRIISVPPGDAPQWVREKWVGLELPIVETGRSRFRTLSIKVRPTLLQQLWAMLQGQSEMVTGYLVPAGGAVDILARSSPEAADWWRQNTPSILRPRQCFVFHAEACELNGA